MNTDVVGETVGGVSLVVLAKDARLAKTRLPLDRADARGLALVLAARTLRVGLAARTVNSVYVVTSDPDIAGDALAAGALVVPERRPLGMNRAAELGRRRAVAERPRAAVAIAVADLPDLVPADLDVVLGHFLITGAPSFVPDHNGTGTTFVVHGPGDWPGVAFGPGSATMHERLGYRRTAPSPQGLRRDLDTATDLASRPDLTATLRSVP